MCVSVFVCVRVCVSVFVCVCVCARTRVFLCVCVCSESELRRRSEEMGVPVGLLSARVLLENIEDLITQTDTNTQPVLLNAKQRVCHIQPIVFTF